ncbi:IQ domain-containing protein G [Orussus abietinus]|uniref:IQ domain-containing protein G n=1 Tax=Orussus abietinus TaxID=222816 RepID=UPI000625CA1F|nr:IQ domain-containing protein G [Orussus abietinus]
MDQTTSPHVATTVNEVSQNYVAEESANNRLRLFGICQMMTRVWKSGKCLTKRKKRGQKRRNPRIMATFLAQVNLISLENVLQPQFRPLERKAILSVLEECSDMLTIYQQTLKSPVIKHDVHIDFVPPEVRRSTAASVRIFGYDPLTAFQDIDKQAVFQKLSDDSSYIKNLIENIKESIDETGRFDILPQEIEKILSDESAENALLCKSEETKRIVKKIRAAIVDEDIKSNQEKKQLQDTFIRLQGDMEQLKIKVVAESRYVKGWETARREQNSLRFDIVLDRLNTVLQNSAVKMKNERRITREIEAFLLEDMAANENEMEYWKAEHRKEVKRYEGMIDELHIEINAIESVLEHLREEYRDRQEFIDTYLEEKETLRKQREYEELVQRSAIKIQAWWRGVMVRRKLGPYHVEEKKKKKSKK